MDSIVLFLATFFVILPFVKGVDEVNNLLNYSKSNTNYTLRLQARKLPGNNGLDRNYLQSTLVKNSGESSGFSRNTGDVLLENLTFSPAITLRMNTTNSEFKNYKKENGKNFSDKLPKRETIKKADAYKFSLKSLMDLLAESSLYRNISKLATRRSYYKLDINQNKNNTKSLNKTSTGVSADNLLTKFDKPNISMTEIGGLNHEIKDYKSVLKNMKPLKEILNNEMNLANFYSKKLLDPADVSEISDYLNKINETLETVLKAPNTFNKSDFNRHDYKPNLQFTNESNKSNQTYRSFFDSLIKISTQKKVAFENNDTSDKSPLESNNATVNRSENVLTKKMKSSLFSYEEKKTSNREQYAQVGVEAEGIDGSHQREVKVKAAVIKRSRSSAGLNQSRVVNEAPISSGHITATTALPHTTGSRPVTTGTNSFVHDADKSSNILENYKIHTTQSLLEFTITEKAVAATKNSQDMSTSTLTTTVAQVESVLQPQGGMSFPAWSDDVKKTRADLKFPPNDSTQSPQTTNAHNLTVGERCENCSEEVAGKTLLQATDDTTPRLNINENLTNDIVFTTALEPVGTERTRLDDENVVKHEKQLIKPPTNNLIPNATIKLTEYPWPVKKEAIMEGDIILGGLMMVHERKDSITCGPVMPQGGIQALEVMLYTIEYFNQSPEQKGLNITLGAHILDDCDKDTYGLEMAVDFIKGSISNIDGAEYSCNRSQVRKVISGVVGAASSVTSIQVANLLRLFKIPQVSFFSTSPELSNKQRFEYFSRTIPSDHYQVKAMVDIVIMLNWSYVSIIYEESNYGIKGFEELEDLLAKKNICIAVKEKLVKDSGVANESAYDTIVTKLLTKPRARGVIIFGSDQEVAGVMRAVRRNNATGSFSWIGSDGWSGRTLVSDGNEAEVEGTLSVQPKANVVQGFEDYFLGLNVENNKRNPWFVEFWEHHFECRYANSSRTPYNQNYTRMCTGHEKLTSENTAFENQLQFVSDAVMAFGYAILDMHKELCENRTGLCDAMKPTKGTELLKYLKKVNFTGLSGDQFNFDENGDGPARYNIIHFKQYSSGKYSWTRVGEYTGGKLNLTMSDIQFKLGHPEPPESVCSLPCDLGQAKKYVEGESCCWHCFNCTQYQIRHPTDPTQCIGCPMGTVPDSLHVRCVDIPEEYLLPDSGWAIGAMALSSSGILITMFVCGVFIRHNDTPVVRASGRELSYVLLAGILMCYCVTYALVLRPNNIVCGIQRFGAGFCFTVVYAALLTKTNRISRIFNAGKSSAKRPSFISPRSQLIICSGLVGVQILINGIWMVISPPKAIHHYPTREDNLLVCSSYIDASYMIAFSYPILLIVVCTIYAVLTRKIPEAFNESKHIGFTMYTTCVIWLAFVPLYFGTANHVALRITSMSVTISLSASVTVACLFSPKLYIILIRPERNIRQSMMPMRYSAINKSTTATTNSGAGSMMAAVMVTAATCNQKNQIEKHVPPPESISEKEVYVNSDKSKPDTRDTSTQTIPVPSALNNDVVINKSEDHLQKVNNNHNDPSSLSHGVQIKEISL